MRNLWKRVDALVDAAPSLAAIEAHGLSMLAAQRWRALGREVPSSLGERDRVTTARLLAVPILVERVRSAYDGPIVVVKGPEVASYYPNPGLRPFGDLDLLVPDAAAAQAALERAEFVPVSDPDAYAGKYHRVPLALPGHPLHVELHQHPKWPRGLAPPTDALFRVAVRPQCGLEGVLAPPPAHHALVLAAHSWAHEPLRRLLDLIDIAAVLEDVDRANVRSLADEYGLRRLWSASEAAMDALLGDGGRTFPLRTWARNLPEVRERTVFESHLTRWISDFSAVSPLLAARRIGFTIRRELGLAQGETVRSKLNRTARAIRNARRTRSEHERSLP